MRIIVTSVSFALAAGLVVGCTSESPDESVAVQFLDGAIFTTLPDGSRVNANIYSSKSDVYLDGGPGSGAPAKAAALPAGTYYFQVTDPSGKTLLSTDAVTCRQFTVDDAGLISAVGGGGCAHATGVDADHGALTVQLMPYLDTPNNGGEYKVWITPVADYEAGAGTHGFIARFSKTDNFKVREDIVTPPPPPPEEEMPCCGDGHVDAGEECDDGNTTNGDGCSATCQIEEPPPPPPPAPCCGDGLVDAGEDCDDGNTTSGDGCSSVCTSEVSYPPGDSCDGTCQSVPYISTTYKDQL